MPCGTVMNFLEEFYCVKEGAPHLINVSDIDIQHLDHDLHLMLEPYTPSDVLIQVSKPIALRAQRR
jgi:hypothetical protein